MRAAIERTAREAVAGFTGLQPDDIDVDADLHSDLGMASLDLVLLRESIERNLAIIIRDDEVPDLTSISAIADLVEAKRAEATPAATPAVEAAPAQPQSQHLTAGSQLKRELLHTDLEVGMPMTGRNNLAETALLREVGHLRWQHISALTGVPSKDVIDEDGERLYPTFFFVELAFPPARPMATYGENDRVTVVSSLRRYGRSMLDGEHYLFPADEDEVHKRPPVSPEDGLKAGVPFLRLSNSFVKQWQGAGWLKKSRPADPGFDRIPETAEPPDSHTESNRAKESGMLFDVPDGYVPLSDGPVRVEYEIVPDRDLNGAGLLYFANYPMILDIAERKYLNGISFDDDLIDHRTLVHRKAAYFANASQKERLNIDIQAWVNNPVLTGEDPDIAPVRLLLNYRMERESDQRMMMVSTAKKVIMGRPMGETNLLDSFLHARDHD